LLVGSAAYQSSLEYRPGTAEQTICGGETGAIFVRCSVTNIDRPYRRDGIILAGELRTQFNNVPVLGVLGLGPRYSIRLEDDRNQIDVPIYLSAKDGVPPQASVCATPGVAGICSATQTLRSRQTG
jgi:hypothetical protein